MLVALALALRVYRIDLNSFWTDEVTTVLWIRNSLKFLWTQGQLIDPTPPLYFTLLKGWVAALGSDAEGPVRLMGALISAAAVIPVFLLGRELVGARGAWVAALLIAINPMEIFYAQEARVYALIPCFLALALLGLAEQARDPVAGRRGLALYAIGSVLLIYCHVTSLITVFAITLGALIHRLREDGAEPHRLWRHTLPLLLAILSVGVVGAPRIWLALFHDAGIAWIEKPNLISVLSMLTSIVVDPETPQVAMRLPALLTALLGLVMLLALLRRRIAPRILDLIILPVAIFVVTALLVSLIKPLFIPRIAIWIPVPLAVLIAYAFGLDAPRPAGAGRLTAAALAGCLVLVSGVGLYGVYVRQAELKEDWRGMATTLAERAAPGDEFVLGPTTNPKALVFYGERDHARTYGTPELPWCRWTPRPMPPMLWLPTKLREPVHVDTGQLRTAMSAPQRFWIVMNRRDWTEYQALVGQLQAEQVIAGGADRSHAGLVLLSTRLPPATMAGVH